MARDSKMVQGFKGSRERPRGGSAAKGIRTPAEGAGAFFVKTLRDLRDILFLFLTLELLNF